MGKFQPRAARMREMGETARRFTNVFIKNFADELDKEKLEKLFAKFGKITSCAVMSDADGKSKGFGFVAFENPEDAEKVSFRLFPHFESHLTCFARISSFCRSFGIFSKMVIV